MQDVHVTFKHYTHGVVRRTGSDGASPSDEISEKRNGAMTRGGGFQNATARASASAEGAGLDWLGNDGTRTGRSVLDARATPNRMASSRIRMCVLILKSKMQFEGII
jgi:hypothetical protein